ncbi:MAG: hypothetical protein C6Y22_26610 [Hapalosiphonaceae cyanobacterium JJU2]|nr:MAG: hypothetical protein C6Y22_26610 [Hapalosiphonaceae cyanobacterium JJU2]
MEYRSTCTLMEVKNSIVITSEQVASQLKIVLCQRRYPSEGGIVERPFGTFNTELLSTLPGYTGSNVKQRPKSAEKEASLTLEQLERLIVRYIVERYNRMALS